MRVSKEKYFNAIHCTSSFYNSSHSFVSESKSGSTGLPVPTGKEVNHLLYMDDLKLSGKSKDDLETLMNTARTFTDDGYPR